MMVQESRKNVQSLLNSYGELWLNVGSGRYPLENFINLDNSIWLALTPFYPVIGFLLRPHHRKIIEEFKEAQSRAPILYHDCRKPLKLPNESVDHILCSHFLEHVYPDEAIKILKDFHRVLKKGGTLHVIVPNLRTMINEYAHSGADGNAADRLLRNTLLSNESKPGLTYRILEWFGYEGLQHRWMYDKASMSQRLINIGFQLLDVNNSPSSAVRLDDGDASVNLLAQKT